MAEEQSVSDTSLIALTSHFAQVRNYTIEMYIIILLYTVVGCDTYVYVIHYSYGIVSRFWVCYSNLQVTYIASLKEEYLVENEFYLLS